MTKLKDRKKHQTMRRSDDDNVSFVNGNTSNRSHKDENNESDEAGNQDGEEWSTEIVPITQEPPSRMQLVYFVFYLMFLLAVGVFSLRAERAESLRNHRVNTDEIPVRYASSIDLDEYIAHAISKHPAEWLSEHVMSAWHSFWHTDNAEHLNALQEVCNIDIQRSQFQCLNYSKMSHVDDGDASTISNSEVDRSLAEVETLLTKMVDETGSDSMQSVDESLEETGKFYMQPLRLLFNFDRYRCADRMQANSLQTHHSDVRAMRKNELSIATIGNGLSKNISTLLESANDAMMQIDEHMGRIGDDLNNYEAFSETETAKTFARKLESNFVAAFSGIDHTIEAMQELEQNFVDSNSGLLTLFVMIGKEYVDEFRSQTRMSITSAKEASDRLEICTTEKDKLSASEQALREQLREFPENGVDEVCKAILGAYRDIQYEISQKTGELSRLVIEMHADEGDQIDLRKRIAALKTRIDLFKTARLQLGRTADVVRSMRSEWADVRHRMQSLQSEVKRFVSVLTQSSSTSEPAELLKADRKSAIQGFRQVSNDIRHASRCYNKVHRDIVIPQIVARNEPLVLKEDDFEQYMANRGDREEAVKSRIKQVLRDNDCN